MIRHFFAGITCAVLAGTGWSIFSFFKSSPQTPITLEDMGFFEEDSPSQIVNLNYLKADFKGNSSKVFLPIKKPYLIHVWATWCPPCIKELPSYSKFAANYPGKVITLSPDSLRDIQTFLKKHNISGLESGSDEEKVILRVFSVSSLPTTIIVKGNGKILRASGMLKWDNKSLLNILKKELGVA